MSLDQSVPGPECPRAKVSQDRSVPGPECPISRSQNVHADKKGGKWHSGHGWIDGYVYMDGCAPVCVCVWACECVCVCVCVCVCPFVLHFDVSTCKVNSVRKVREKKRNKKEGERGWWWYLSFRRYVKDISLLKTCFIPLGRGGGRARERERSAIYLFQDT